jgi:primosomal protein N' (replication factor Y)
VPEIALTHQVINAFQEVFGDAVVREQLAVLHSGLTTSMRLREWSRILHGEARLVVGVRSAVFAPLPSLGLIVMDEEHENTYKAGAAPRYHARQVAMHRVQEEGGLLLMGSATPSLEAYHWMKSGELKNAALGLRSSGGQMPKVEIINLQGDEGPLSKRLIEEIEATKKRGRQTILFLNRRGFSHFFRCRSCGFEMKCARCSVSLTFHKNRGLLVCHYCGYKTKPTSVCPVCQSLDVGYLGFGTERIEEDIGRIFPDFVIRRVDTDAVRKKNELATILRDFKDGKIDILLGTQMVAKGLNVKGLSLVGIVLADTSLLLPDFRSAERTFNLIVQVGGRAGRFDKDGKVLIQTYRGTHDAILCAARLQIDEYYERELEVRRELEFPPFSRLIRLVFRGKEKNKASVAAASFAALCSKITGKKIDRRGRTLGNDSPSASLPEIEILGPAECPLSMIAHNHRFQLIVRSSNFGALHHMVKSALDNYKPPAGVYIEVDVDPLSLL